MKKTLLISALLFCFSSFGQKYTFDGKVVDGSNTIYDDLKCEISSFYWDAIQANVLMVNVTSPSGENVPFGFVADSKNPPRVLYSESGFDEYIGCILWDIYTFYTDYNEFSIALTEGDEEGFIAFILKIDGEYHSMLFLPYTDSAKDQIYGILENAIEKF